jgi:hypothetical protein
MHAAIGASNRVAGGINPQKARSGPTPVAAAGLQGSARAISAANACPSSQYLRDSAHDNALIATDGCEPKRHG